MVDVPIKLSKEEIEQVKIALGVNDVGAELILKIDKEFENNRPRTDEELKILDLRHCQKCEKDVPKQKFNGYFNICHSCEKKSTPGWSSLS